MLLSFANLKNLQKHFIKNCSCLQSTKNRYICLYIHTSSLNNNNRCEKWGKNNDLRGVYLQQHIDMHMYLFIQYMHICIISKYLLVGYISYACTYVLYVCMYVCSYKFTQQTSACMLFIYFFKDINIVFVRKFRNCVKISSYLTTKTKHM